MLTVKDLDEMQPNKMFAVGEGLILHPWFNDAKILYNAEGERYSGEEGYGIPASHGYRFARVKWVARRGGINDWAIYHSLDANLENANYLDGEDHLQCSDKTIADFGAKLYNIKEIMTFVPCDTEALKLYRF